jgi:nucleolar protein 56
VTHVLFESASGYAVFDVLEAGGVAALEQHAQESINDFGRFSRVVRLRAFAPFTSAEHALENISCVSEGAIHDFLRSVLTGNLDLKSSGKSSGKSSVVLGVQDVKLATSLNEQLGVSCTSAAAVAELCRGIRLHLDTFVSQLKDGLLGQAQLGLAHSYSRAKVKFNVNRADNMILQSINLLDKIDKDINTFAMRCREWYSWHFPELVKVVNDNHLFARCMQFIKHKEQLTDDALPALEEIVQDAGVAQQIVQAARTSMGTQRGAARRDARARVCSSC